MGISTDNDLSREVQAIGYVTYIGNTLLTVALWVRELEKVSLSVNQSKAILASFWAEPAQNDHIWKP